MKYGYFDDAAREYVITRPDTPYPWINYLGEEDFFSLMSNTSGGYTFYKDARLLRLTRYRYNNVPTDARPPWCRWATPPRLLASSSATKPIKRKSLPSSPSSSGVCGTRMTI